MRCRTRSGKGELTGIGHWFPRHLLERPALVRILGIRLSLIYQLDVCLGGGNVLRQWGYDILAAQRPL